MLPTLPILNHPLLAAARRRRQEQEQTGWPTAIGGTGAVPLPLDMPPEENTGVMDKILGGLEFIGLTLDKPGAAVRGVASGLAGGDWGGGLQNLIPFSDMLGITKPEERVSGRDMLETFGWLNANTPGLDWGDVAGVTAEVALDPFSWIGGPAGALTKTGKAAQWSALGAKGGAIGVKEAAEEGVKRLGQLGKLGGVMGTTWRQGAEEIEQGLRGVAQIHPPFWAKGLFEPIPIGAGSTIVPKIIRGVTGSVPARWVRGLMDPKVQGLFDKTAQVAADHVYHQREQLRAIVQDVGPVFARSMGELQGSFADLAKHAMAIGADTTPGGASTMRDIQELTTYLSEHAPLLQKKYTTLRNGIVHVLGGVTDPNIDPRSKIKVGDELIDMVTETVDGMLSIKDALYDKALNLGLKGDWLDDIFTSHWPRRAGSAAVAYQMDDKTLQLLGTKFGHALHREDTLRHIPEGKRTINRLAMDERLRWKADDLRAWIAADRNIVDPEELKILEETPIDVLRQGIVFDEHLAPAGKRWEELSGKKIPPTLNEVQKSALAKARAGGVLTKEEAALIQGLDPDVPIAWEDLHTKAGELLSWVRGLPKDTVTTGVFNRPVMDELAGYMNGLTHVYGSLLTMHNLIRGGVKLTQEHPGPTINLYEAVSSLTLPSGKKLSAGLFSERGLERLAEDIATDLGAPPQALASIRANPKEYLKNLDIPEPVAKALRAHVEAMTHKPVPAWLETYDKMHGLWKAWVTTAANWPAFNVRNGAAGFWQNWAHGEIGFLPLVKAYKETAKWLHDGTGEVTKYLDELLYGDPLAMGAGQLEDISKVLAERTASATMKGKGVLTIDNLFIDPFRGVPGHVKESLNPFNVIGGFANTEKIIKQGGKQFVLAEMGQRTYGVVEAMNRISPYIALREAGMTPAQAAYRVRQIQFDYGDISPFTAKLGKRIVPFLTWSSKNVPLQISKLMMEPGGKAAQTIRAVSGATRGGPEEPYTPAWLQEGTALRVGGTDEEAMFLRWLGIPIEDLNKFRFFRSRPSAQSLRRGLADLNPFLQTVLKLYSGKDPFTGRDIKDLYGPTQTVLGEDQKMPWLDAIISSSPGARVLTTGRQLTDTRHSLLSRLLNVGTGVKLGVYDTEKWRILDARNRQREILDDNPDIRTGEHYYIKPDRKAQASEQTKQDLARLRALDKAVKALQKKRDAALVGQ